MSRPIGLRGSGQHRWRWVLADEYRKLPPRVRWLGLASLVAAVAAIVFSLGFALHSVRDTSAAPLAGAIFTTTPDGGIVNENVHYQSKIEVYLDGGPGPNAPQTAAGLPDGDYYFQVTDPSGKVLLSEDPAKCRGVRVADGVIVALVNGGDYDPPGREGPFPCHIQDEPDGVAGPSGRHDTNTDKDHGPPAIVVQLMPFFDTPNPGGVYKAWIIPVARYVANGGDPEAIPSVLKVKGKQVGFVRDPGFGPPRDQVKTDNFKVKEFFPPEIKVRKFHDVNGNGIWDRGVPGKPDEPEIGVDQCVDDITGAIILCPGGWPYDFTEPVDGGTVTNTFYTPHTHVAGIPGTYNATELIPPGWLQTAAYRDADFLGATPSVNVVVAGTSGEKHEVRFGNFRKVSVEACKFDDKTGDGLTRDDTPIAGWTVILTGDGDPLDTQLTGANGCYKWTNLGPRPGGYYDVSEVVPPGWVPTSATSHRFESPPTSGASYTFTFTNFKLGEIQGRKFEDVNGDGSTTGDPGLGNWTINLYNDGTLVATTKTCGAPGPACPMGKPVGWFSFEGLKAGTYRLQEVCPSGWIQTVPGPETTEPNCGSNEITGITINSGTIATGKDFANFKLVKVTACKLNDADGSLATTDDQTPIAGWTVMLTKNGEVQDTQRTGADGCYTWTNLGPVPGGYYDVSEVVPPGWVPLTPTSYNFESPPHSGASYSFTFINTPTQGCTPGYWKVEQHWDSWPAPWSPSGPLSAMFSGVTNPPYATFVVTSPDGTSVLMGSATQVQALHFQGGNSVPEKAEILLRAAVAAVLNADSPGVNFPWTSAQVIGAVDAALASQDATTIIDLANQLDADNNGPGGCPLN